MKNFIVYSQDGKILRTGNCSDYDFLLQAGAGEFVMKGTANDVTQKIINPGIAGKIVDKTPQEIEAEKPPVPPVIPFEKQTAHINNEQWQNVLSRLDKLKNNSSE